MNYNLLVFSIVVLAFAFYMYHSSKDIKYIEINARVIKCSCNIVSSKLKCSSHLVYSHNNQEFNIHLPETFCSGNSTRKIFIDPNNPKNYVSNLNYIYIYPALIILSSIGIISSLFI